MGDIFDMDSPKRQQRFIARSKKGQKGAGISKDRNAGLSRKKGKHGDIKHGFTLKIRPLWMILFLIVLLGLALLFLRHPEKPQKALAKGIKKIEKSAPPKIQSVYIAPDKPYVQDCLSANVNAIGDGQNRIFFRYEWYKNDFEIQSVNSKNLSNVHFGKGDIIKVRVIPIMNAIEGKPLTSAAVQIRNSIPYIQSVMIKPDLVYTNVDLTVAVEAEDPDMDEVDFRYQWIKNGTEIPGQESADLQPSHFKKNDEIRIKVVPFDGDDYGNGMLSGSVIVNNSPPRIVSNPPSILGEDGTYMYEVVAEDIDNDPLIFSLTSNNPPGISIDSQTGLLFWKIPSHLDSELNRIEIIVSDDDGSEASQWFSLNIQFAVTKSLI
ncbi:MAG: hypothetical protein ACMUIM_04900 [bacterium]